MNAVHTGISEAAIFGRVLEPEEANSDVAAARAILELDFRAARQGSHACFGFAKAKKGTLAADEQVETDNYERVGHMLSLMKSKARRSIKGRRGNGTGEVH